jgi:hypothetical protein
MPPRKPPPANLPPPKCIPPPLKRRAFYCSPDGTETVLQSLGGGFGENGLRPAAGVSVFCCVNQANCNEEVIMKTFMGFRSVASWLPFSNKAASMALMGHCPERLGLPAREAAQIAAVLNARSIA